MEITIGVLLLILSLSSAHPVKRVAFECPPAEQIHPCTCSAHPRKIVKCDDVKDLDAVRSALDHHFEDPLPALHITNVHTFLLPDHALRNITARKLVLNGSNIKRIHDDAFDGQDNLSFLILSEDRITDFPTKALKRLTRLRTLSLAGNFIMKLSEGFIGHHPHLKTLVLSQNRISVIEKGAFPRSLESLMLNQNLLATLNGTLLDLHNLEMFSAAHNRLLSVRGDFDDLRHLRYLSLERNSLHDITSSFDDLTSLKHLNIAYNSLAEVETGLMHLSGLQTLNLSYNYIRDLGTDLFKRLKRIEVLDLSGNYISDTCEALSNLRDMKELRLANMNLQSVDRDCFKHMRSLSWLDLSGNRLSNIDAVIGHSFPQLTTLHLRSNQLSFFSKGLKNVRNIYELDIEDNRFSSLKRSQLAHNSKLRVFKIKGNPWDCSRQLLELFRELQNFREVQLLDPPSCPGAKLSVIINHRM